MRREGLAAAKSPRPRTSTPDLRHLAAPVDLAQKHRPPPSNKRNGKYRTKERTPPWSSARDCGGARGGPAWGRRGDAGTGRGTPGRSRRAAWPGYARAARTTSPIDANGYLHFKITSAGGAWTAAEMFTTDKLGFGTYQWQVDGPIDTYDKNVVLGLLSVRPGRGHRRRRHQRDRHRVLALGPGERPERRLDRLSGVGNDHRRAELLVLARRSHPVDLALHWTRTEHHELPVRRACSPSTARRG